MGNVSPATPAKHGATPGLALWAQRGLIAAAVLAGIFLLVSIVQQIAATRPAATPARVVTLAAGPYPLTVSFSRYPAAAGYALPFAIAPTQPIAGTLSYAVSVVPGDSVDATPVNASLSRDPHAANRVTGAVEITVRGQWALDIAVDGPAGHGEGMVPIAAQAAGVIPTWIAWLIGIVPAAGIALYFLAQRRASKAAHVRGDVGTSGED